MTDADISVAGRWFGVRMIYQEATLGWNIFAAARTVLLLIVTLGTSILWYEPKRFCDVILYRLDNGVMVCRFDYNETGDATAHAASLRERLASEHIFDFCRELGISIGQVVGPGQDFSTAEDLVDWVEVPASRRYDDLSPAAEGGS